MIKQKSKLKKAEIGMIPEDWNISKLGDLGELKNGVNFNRGDFGKGLPVINVTNLFRGRYATIENLDEIKKESIPNYHKYLVKRGDILFARSSLVHSGAGQAAMVKNLDSECIFSGFIIRFRKFERVILDYDFLNYLVRSEWYRKYFTRLLDGTTITNINQQVLSNIPIISPPITEQRKISKILSDLDSKIELNQQMNKTLEAIGQALFKKWFVDNPENEEWEEGFLGDGILTELIKPGIYEFEGEKIYIPTANISNSTITSYDYKITFEERPSRASMQPKADTIWFAKMKDSPKIQLFLGGENWRLNNLILSTGFAGIKPKKEALFYIWNIISSPFFEIEKDNLAMGTTMQAINNQNIEKIKYSIPDKQTLIKFNGLVKPLYYLISNNNLQNQNLSQIRDSLLPRLMSGKIRVPVEVK